MARRLMGYWLSGHDNKSFYFEDTEVPACEGCGLVTQNSWLNPTFRVVKRDLDVSYTYDGAPIVSSSFAQFVSAHEGARTVVLPADPDFHLLVVDRIVKQDPTARPVLFEYQCESCGRYRQISRPEPIVLTTGPLQPGFSATDIRFGSARDTPNRKTSQGPLILVDPSLGAELLEAGFRGRSLTPFERTVRLSD